MQPLNASATGNREAWLFYALSLRTREKAKGGVMSRRELSVQRYTVDGSDGR
jgi:hypothetical protein